jgi:hypothetical protein
MEKQKPTIGRPFEQGDPRAGRPKGTPNKVTIEARLECQRLLSDRTYRAKLLTDLRRRKLHPAIECMFWHYAYGKPKHTVRVESSDLPAFKIIVDDRVANTVTGCSIDGMVPLIVDKVSTRAEMLAALGVTDDDDYSPEERIE